MMPLGAYANWCVAMSTSDGCPQGVMKRHARCLVGTVAQPPIPDHEFTMCSPNCTEALANRAMRNLKQ